jgi:molybdenum cofactor guanylyltransferase
LIDRQPGPRVPREVIKDVAGFVLAGGRSSRMGRDKALLELGSLKLIEWAKMILAGAGLDFWIAGARNPELAAFGPVIPDLWEDAGPLGGVCSALRHTDRNWAVFVTVDQPLMAPALVSQLLDRARTGGSAVTVASLHGAAQTFPAVLRRHALKALEAELEAGRLGCLQAFRAAGLAVVAAEELAVPADGLRVEEWFWNVNSPKELEAIAEALQRRPAVG